MSTTRHPDEPRPVAVHVEVVHPALRPRYDIAVGLLVATLFTTLVVGARLQYNFIHGLAAFSASEDSLPMFPLRWIVSDPRRLLLGIPFSLSVMGILLAHELGHYIACRYYRIDATLPYFIPAPTLVGTLGAFIKIRSSFHSRRALFDIAIAGPIAGFIASIPIIFIGLVHSRALTSAATQNDFQLGFPLMFRVTHRMLLSMGAAPAAPLPQLLLHPLAIAGWVGMFATALNLLPGGQLDGGHMIYAFSPRAHRFVSWLAILALVPMAYYFWAGWLIWAIVLSITGLRHPSVHDWRKMTSGRSVLLLVGVAMLALSLTPAPFSDSGIRDAKQDIVDALRSLGPWLKQVLHR